MEKRRFTHNYTNKPVVKSEHIKSETLSTKVGYVPLEVRIREVMSAGKRLQAARLGAYDSDEKNIDVDNDDYIDPTREPGYDLADASQNLNALVEQAKVVFGKKNVREVKANESGKNKENKFNDGVASVSQKAPENADSEQPLPFHGAPAKDDRPSKSGFR